jgi:cell division protein FtsI/penicillin-binding protein 2
MNNLRPNLIIFFVVLISATVIGRLIYIQVLNDQYWRALALGQQNKFENVLGERGKIFFDDGVSALAINRDSFFAYVSPGEIKDQASTTEILSQTLAEDKNFISEKLTNKDSMFELLKDNLSASEVENLKNQNTLGVYLGTKRQRYWPQGTLASDLLGFVDTNGAGQYGLESYYDDILQGQADKSPGTDLDLTIDYNVQFMAEKLLKKAVDDLGAQGGQVVVVDPNSGAIIALADYPSFDPNNYSQYAQDDNMIIFQNPVTQKTYEPGSAFKPITMAIALEEGKITPQTTYQDKGVIKIGGRTIYNYAQRTYSGDITMTEVLEKSINTGAVFAEQQVSHNVFLDYLDRFGFFEKTGIDLPEVFSENKSLKKGYEINFATASFGQGIEITPMQLVRAFCAIANGGKLPRPYLAQKENDNGKISQTKTELSGQIISQKTASQVATMMVSVIENGYGKAAKIPGYYIAGKTGTAQVAEGGGYSADKTIQSFVGFGPAYSPRFVILVKLDNPKAKTAEYSALPVFHDLAKYIINLWQLAPDYKI